jgi:hypothetical protein
MIGYGGSKLVSSGLGALYHIVHASHATSHHIDTIRGCNWIMIPASDNHHSSCFNWLFHFYLNQLPFVLPSNEARYPNM